MRHSETTHAPMRSFATMQRFPRSLARLAMIAASIGVLAGSAFPAFADDRGNDPSYYDSHSAPLPDWEVFGFDLTSVPGDVESLMAFKASLDPRTQLAVNNRCRQNITVMPWRYSPKVRMFCWGH
ncbi:hypothetical protein OSH11_00295 [Kaistia dalseonensis]|uniref:Uncharacterized protein n=1 Tax=Kaistia dalseonensis TaxID=410840 RepID=A0ABU0H053_9HYPH|nr:hypothetical protein [Kaistia dalseonensis]MCX5493135.1 hypothetical protein [Kaistia dalseonensis]MDQ0435690.1 hypothetical protein [Kaistia dalseonensis]